MREYDVVIIGAGVSGSIAAALLARQGYQVVILEQMTSQGFHLAENVVIDDFTLFEEFGIKQQIIQSLRSETSIALAFHDGSFLCRLSSKQLTPIEGKGSYWVNRIAFDQVLRDNAEYCGAELLMNCRAEEFIFDERKVQVTYSDHQRKERIQAKYLIDASGKMSVLGNYLQLKEVSEVLDHRTAVFAHYDDVDLTYFQEHMDAGIVAFDDGYFILLPIADNRVSIGVILTEALASSIGPDPMILLEQLLSQSEVMRTCLREAHRVTPCFTVKNRSYQMKQMCSSKYFITGDAATFEDPVFSSGIQFAIKSGMLAAETVGSLLDGQQSEAEVENYYTEHLSEIVDKVKNSVSDYYDHPLYKRLLAGTVDPHLPNLLSLVMLAGVSRTVENGSSLERIRIARDTFVPSS